MLMVQNSLSNLKTNWSIWIGYRCFAILRDFNQMMSEWRLTVDEAVWEKICYTCITRNVNCHLDRMNINCNYLSYSPNHTTKKLFDHEGLVGGLFISQNNSTTTYSYVYMVEGNRHHKNQALHTAGPIKTCFRWGRVKGELIYYKVRRTAVGSILNETCIASQSAL